jgi:uncharacterized damage-inducible protein DinB
MKQHFQMMAGYNRWANERVYAAAQNLPDADYRADRGAFFGSVHRTLNHILVGDRIWMHRFTGAGQTYSELDSVPHDGFQLLRADRIAEDERIAGWIDGLSEDQLAGAFSYRTISNSADISQPLAPALTHFFNHQTHHRGQVHALLSGLGVDPPSLDLIAFQRETGIGMRV